MNKAMFIGRTTKDLEVQEVGANATKRVRFQLAVRRQFTKEGQPDTDFISVVAFGKTAELLARLVKKGDQVGLETRVQTGSYEKDGARVYTTDFIIDSFTLIGSKGGDNPTATETTTAEPAVDAFTEDALPWD